MSNKLIGRKVIITDKYSWACGEWGIVKYFDGDYYYVAVADGDETLVFKRDEFKVIR